VYYFAIGISTFMRTIISQFIGFKDHTMVKKCISQILGHVAILGLICGLLFFVMRNAIGFLFFQKEEQREIFSDCMLYFMLGFIQLFCLPVLPSLLRYL
jgi:Na+-driven multidrug efflux pump